MKQLLKNQGVFLELTNNIDRGEIFGTCRYNCISSNSDYIDGI